MDLLKKASIVFYRFKEHGLEIFLTEEDGQWGIPKAELSSQIPSELSESEKLIELDPVQNEEGTENALAVEGDWHEIPSLKSMLQEDAIQLKEKFKEIEKGHFVSVKDAFKKVLPHQYAFLKELKDVLTERRNSLF